MNDFSLPYSKTHTPIADDLIRRKYGLPHDFDLDSVPLARLESIGYEFQKKAKARMAKEAAELAKQPPPIIPKFFTTAAYKTGARHISGVASTGAINSHGYALHPGGCRIILPVPLLLRHDANKCVGSVAAAQIEEDGKIRIWANLDQRCDAKTWGRIQNGELAGFSGAADWRPGTFTPPITVCGVDNYYDWRLEEVSLCERGANHECVVDDVWPPADFEKSSDDSKPVIKIDLTSLEERVAQLEAKPALEYKGVWKINTLYKKGEFVTCGGSTWHCNQQTLGKPGACNEWTMAVKRGQNGMDAR